MLKRKYRLLVKTRLINTRIIKSPIFTLKFTKNGLPYNRFGFVISKNVDKRAVERNRIKRLLRSCIEAIFHTIVSGYDMLFIIHPGAKQQKREDISLQLKQILTKYNLII